MHSTACEQVPTVQLCMHVQVRNERSRLADALVTAEKELKGYKEDVVQGFQSERVKASALESRTRAQVSFCSVSLPAQAAQIVAARLQGHGSTHREISLYTLLKQTSPLVFTSLLASEGI